MTRPRYHTFIDKFCLATTTDCAAPTALSSAATVSQAVGKTRMQGGLAFASSAVTTNTALGCSLYLDRCIRELHRTIPLTIFCCKWQKDVQAPDPKRHRVGKSSTKATGYLGYQLDREWTQAGAVWEHNHRSIYKTLVNVTSSLCSPKIC
ncbi:hypothetical protein PSTT_13836 [Puccinia striiformis]|uniref:Uncharacterized protein n=1 Tax=Puccinia striiformis TaxID=27350 RepID=A0A2S4UQ61_9BASI|nr:hypothetical protein PSTT_13836 [Puccinia striiformis]